MSDSLFIRLSNAFVFRSQNLQSLIFNMDDQEFLAILDWPLFVT